MLVCLFCIPNGQRLNVPNALCILTNNPIRREEPHARNTSNALIHPLLAVPKCLIDEILRRDVAVEVVGDKVVVAVLGDRGEEGREVRRVAECAGADGVEDCGEVGVKLEAAVEVSVADFFDVFGEVAEEEDVIFADLTGYFDL